MIDIALSLVLSIGPMQQPEAIHTRNVIAARSAAEIPKNWEAFQDCVSARESGNSYRAQNRSSSAQGKYQFLDNHWRHGGGWNVYKSLVKNGYDKATAKRLLKRLHALPIKRWKPIYQEILFASVLTSGEGMGWRHWFLAGSKCNRLVKR
jgi:hypothetical protein